MTILHAYTFMRVYTDSCFTESLDEYPYLSGLRTDKAYAYIANQFYDGQSYICGWSLRASKEYVSTNNITVKSSDVWNDVNNCTTQLRSQVITFFHQPHVRAFQRAASKRERYGGYRKSGAMLPSIVEL
jgi:hypothetical protein